MNARVEGKLSDLADLMVRRGENDEKIANEVAKRIRQYAFCSDGTRRLVHRYGHPPSDSLMGHSPAP